MIDLHGGAQIVGVRHSGDYLYVRISRQQAVDEIGHKPWHPTKNNS